MSNYHSQAEFVHKSISHSIIGELKTQLTHEDQYSMHLHLTMNFFKTFTIEKSEISFKKDIPISYVLCLREVAQKQLFNKFMLLIKPLLARIVYKPVAIQSASPKIKFRKRMITYENY